MARRRSKNHLSKEQGPERILKNAGLRLLPIQRDTQLHFPEFIPEDYPADSIFSPLFDYEGSEEQDIMNMKNWLNFKEPIPNISNFLHRIILAFVVVNLIMCYQTVQSPGGFAFILPFLLINLILCGLMDWDSFQIPGLISKLLGAVYCTRNRHCETLAQNRVLISIGILVVVYLIVRYLLFSAISEPWSLITSLLLSLPALLFV